MFQYLTRDKKRILTVLISSLIWGLLVHGEVLFNLYAFYDNADLFNIGGTFEQGRWFLGVISWLTMYVSGAPLYTTPLLNGLFAIIFIGISSYLIINILEIKNTLIVILLNGLMIVFPAVTSAMGYMFTVIYYYFGIFFGIFGIFMFYKNRKWYFYLIGSFLAACGVGCYQANLSLFVGLLLLILIKEIKNNADSMSSYLIDIALYGGMCVLILLLYLVFNKLFLEISGESIAAYKGLDNFGSVTLKEYITRILTAYKEFLAPTYKVSRNMFVFSLEKFYKIYLIIIFLFSMLFLFNEFKKSKLKSLILLILFLFIPLANNFIYFMVDIKYIYSIMMYGEVLVFVFGAYLFENIEFKFKLIYCILRALFILVFMIFCVIYTKFGNVCYLKADVLQTQVRSYITTLATQIKSTDGYYDGINIVYINEDKKNDSSIIVTDEFSEIYIHPYHLDSLIHDYNYRKIMERSIGFYPNKIDSSIYETMEEVKAMPTYPNNGSIKVINDAVVVKFAD